MKSQKFIRVFSLFLLFTGFVPSVGSQTPDPDWYEKFIQREATLSEHWAQNDLHFFEDWFNSDDPEKVSEAKGWLWRQKPSDFKNRVVLMMLRGSPSAWGDHYERSPHVKPYSGNERMGLLNSCDEVIRAVVPDMNYTDLETPEGRAHLTAQFTAALEKQGDPQAAVQEPPPPTPHGATPQSTHPTPVPAVGESHAPVVSRMRSLAGRVLMAAGILVAIKAFRSWKNKD